MKKTIVTISLLAIALCYGNAKAQTVEDADVSLSNLSSNSYFNSYDDNSKMVSGLNFMVLADGTNSNYVTPSFTIKVYIWDGSNPHFVKTYNDPGIYHFGSKTYSNESVDLSGLQLSAGTYRLGVYVDADDDIPNPPDDPNDNAYLLDGDINFTPGSSTGIDEKENSPFALRLFPNPADDRVQVTWEKDSDEEFNTLTIKNMNGQVVKELSLSPGQSSASINTAGLAGGIYLLNLQSDKTVISKKLVKR